MAIPQVPLNSLTGAIVNPLVQVMKDPHESERYLIDWAKAKVDDLGGRCGAFVSDPSTYAIDIEFDTEAMKQIHRIILTRPLPFELRGIASDTVTTLRNALDQACLHCTERINLAAGRTRKIRKAHFPFGRDPADFNDVLVGKNGQQSVDIAPELHQVLRSFEPYPSGAGHVGGNDRLKHIGVVTGPNKHALTLTVAVNSEAVHFGRVNNVSGHWFSILAPHWDPERNGVAIGEAHIDSYINFDAMLGCYIAFDDELIGRYPVDGVLRQWTQIVENVVGRMIEATDSITAL